MTDDENTFLGRFRGLAEIGTANIAGAIILSIFWLFLASLLGTEGYGEISYLIAVANIASVIAFIGAGNTLIVFIAKRVQIVSAIFAITIVTAIITSIGAFLVIQNISIREHRFGFEPEITIKLSRIPNIRIFEIGISYSGRTYKEGKKINWRDGISALYCILRYGAFRLN